MDAENVLLLNQVLCEQAAKPRPRGQQHLRPTLLHDASFLEDEHPITLDDAAQTVAGEQDRDLLTQSPRVP